MSIHRTLQAGRLLVAALFAIPLSADVTLRYKNEITVEPVAAAADGAAGDEGHGRRRCRRRVFSS